jgi:CheY-like chemotaxis protein
MQALAEASFDLVLMDIQMPVMDGLAATRAIRQHGPPWDSLVIVGCSAFASALDRQNAIDAGMHDYLVKPIKRTDFQALLARLSAASLSGSHPALP